MEQQNCMIIDNLPVPIAGEKNILELIRKAGIDLPAFCYHSELSTYGACRMCMVETEQGGLEAA
ncbi:MAG: 2Fe-2S iron-sulfur cluster binding domain-containing protein, partial [Treponema sp.]|nr:2Fe-2S iron-sulfur cluster binding domain-containing protein [Treponema sp.]